MAGAFLELNANTADITAALNRLSGKLGNMTPAFADIGEHLLNSTRKRFDSQTAPDGSAWKALSPDYRKHKKQNPDKILTLHGHLRGLLNRVADAHSVRVGTPLLYGATHQFGDPRRHIPARPVLGLSPADETEVVAIINEWISGAFD